MDRAVIAPLWPINSNILVFSSKDKLFSYKLHYYLLPKINSFSVYLLLIFRSLSSYNKIAFI